MWVKSEEDKYITTTWGTAISLTAGVPKEVGTDVGLICLQQGCTELKDSETPVKEVPVEEVVEIADEAVEVETTAPNLEDMTKIQLEEYGRTLGVELDRRKKKADLIAELYKVAE